MALPSPHAVQRFGGLPAAVAANAFLLLLLFLPGSAKRGETDPRVDSGTTQPRFIGTLIFPVPVNDPLIIRVTGIAACGPPRAVSALLGAVSVDAGELSALGLSMSAVLSVPLAGGAAS
ncbi:hypothetical protein ACN28G_17585 [Micromonospora sp. WMMA1923]|uniref:hypothetical protein n=1 Tax=Micromonospora sp. WMMA1923 TaxID=3404125 RepID=UPI003B936467